MAGGRAGEYIPNRIYSVFLFLLLMYKSLRSSNKTTRPPLARRERALVADLKATVRSAANHPAPRQWRNRALRQRQGISQSLRSQKSSVIGDIVKMPYREECLGSFSTSIAFANSTYIINAANSATLPWLSTIAAKFEYYRFNRLLLKFVSSSADAVGSTNTALGTVLANTNYDVLDAAFTSQIQMEDYGGGKRHMETIPSRNATHVIEPLGVKGGVAGGFRFCLPSGATTAAAAPYPSSSSAHDYDVGLLQVASVGAQAASVAGRLYICYQVDLANPKLETPLGQALPVSHFVLGPTTANAFAGSSLKSGSNLSVTLGTNQLTINSAGRYLVNYVAWAGTSVTAVGNLTASTGATAVLGYSSGSGNSLSSQVNAGSGTALFIDIGCYDIASGGGIITISNTVVGTCYGDLWVTQVPSGLSFDTQPSKVATLESQVNELARMVRVLCNAPSFVIEEDDEEEKVLPISESFVDQLQSLLATKRK